MKRDVGGWWRNQEDILKRRTYYMFPVQVSASPEVTFIQIKKVIVEEQRKFNTIVYYIQLFQTLQQ
jgi:hypothetical protein